MDVFRLETRFAYAEFMAAELFAETGASVVIADAASYVTGQSIIVDGGLTAWAR